MKLFKKKKRSTSKVWWSSYLIDFERQDTLLMLDCPCRKIFFIDFSILEVGLKFIAKRHFGHYLVTNRSKTYTKFSGYATNRSYAKIVIIRWHIEEVFDETSIYLWRQYFLEQSIQCRIFSYV